MKSITFAILFLIMIGTVGGEEWVNKDTITCDSTAGWTTNLTSGTFQVSGGVCDFITNENQLDAISYNFSTDAVNKTWRLRFKLVSMDSVEGNLVFGLVDKANFGIWDSTGVGFKDAIGETTSIPTGTVGRLETARFGTAVVTVAGTIINATGAASTSLTSNKWIELTYNTTSGILSYAYYNDEYITVSEQYNVTDAGGVASVKDAFYVSNDYFNSNNAYNLQFDNITYDIFGAAPGAVTGNLKIITKNESFNIKTTFGEGEEFNVEVNYTLSNGTLPENANCNLTIFGGLVEEETNPEEFNICSAGCNFTSFPWSFNETNAQTTGVNDSLHFSACHYFNPAKNINVNVSCGGYSNIFTVSNNDISLCDSDFSHHVFEFDNCITYDVINITLSNNAALMQSHNISGLSLDREFNPDFMNLTFNSSSNLYVTNHLHEFYEHGFKVIDANCSIPEISTVNVSNTTLITIVNSPPLINFVGLQIDGSFLEVNETGINQYNYENGTWNFLVSILDDDLDTVIYTFYNNSNEVILQNTPNISSSLIVDFSQEPYNLSIFANDTAGNFTEKHILFNNSDIVVPQVSGISNFSVTNDTLINFDVTFTDENFFSFNLTCDNGFSGFATGLNVQSYNFQNSTTITSNTSCTWRFCDGHTGKELLQNWNVLIKNNSLEFRTRNKYKSILEFPNGQITWKQEADRITYDYNPDKDSLEYMLVYHSSANSYYLEDDKYKGWIADADRELWFDTNPYDTEVFRINQTSWELTVSTIDKVLRFESIGEFNCVEIDQFIESTPSAIAGDNELTAGECPTTTGQILMLGLGFIIVITLLIVNLTHIKIRFVNVICGLGLWGLSLIFIACYWFVAMVLGVFGALLILWAFFGSTDWY